MSLLVADYGSDSDSNESDVEDCPKLKFNLFRISILCIL